MSCDESWTPNLYQKRNPYTILLIRIFFHNVWIPKRSPKSFSFIKRIMIITNHFLSLEKKRKYFNWYFKLNLPQIIQGTWTRLWSNIIWIQAAPRKEQLIFKTIMHNTRRICYYQTEIIGYQTSSPNLRRVST